MSIFMSGSELARIAIGIEENGVVFYESLAELTRDKKAQGTYNYLANREREHIEIFQNLLKRIEDYRSPETYTEEYELYLRALVDSNVFTDDQIAREMAKKVTSEAEAVQIGIGAEKDSILFYSELKGLVRRADREIIDKVIEEEKSHMRHLVGLKKNSTIKYRE